MLKVSSWRYVLHCHLVVKLVIHNNFKPNNLIQNFTSVIIIITITIIIIIIIINNNDFNKL